MGQTDDLSDQFFTDIVDVCSRLGCAPRDLLGVMMNESGVRANARNPTSDASGLIQFLPSTLAGLGFSGSTADFRNLSADEQLPWVELYFQPFVHFGLDSAARVYQAVFLPSSLQLGSDFSVVIAQHGGTNSAVYDRNRGLDRNNDGRITVGELEQAIESHFNSARWQEIESRLNDAGGTPSDSNGQGAIDLRTQSGITDALDALGFDRTHFRFDGAVRAFQTQAGLSVDGVVGPRTHAALAAALDDAGIPHVG